MGFDYNWCTFFPDYVCGVYIGDACERHDRRYESTRLTRAQADRLLFREMWRKDLYLTAIIMWCGVRLFGWIYYDTPIQYKK